MWHVRGCSFHLSCLSFVYKDFTNLLKSLGSIVIHSPSLQILVICMCVFFLFQFCLDVYHFIDLFKELLVSKSFPLFFAFNSIGFFSLLFFFPFSLLWVPSSILSFFKTKLRLILRPFFCNIQALDAINFPLSSVNFVLTHFDVFCFYSVQNTL